jgi:signal transduction histidine kinase
MLYVKYSSPVENKKYFFDDQPLLSALFNDAPDAIFLLDSKDFSIIDCNKKAVELFEAEVKSSLINLSSFRLHDNEPIEFSRNILEMNIRNVGEHTQESAFRTLKQNVFWGKLIKRAIQIDSDEFVLLRISKAVEYLRSEETLSTLLRGTAKFTGNKFFKELTMLLCRTFNVKNAFVGKISNNKKVLQIIESYGSLNESGLDKYILQGSLVENVLKGYTTFYPSGSFDLFPNDTFVVANQIEGFMGTPVFGNSGEVIGLIAFMHNQPIEEIPNSRYILSIFASRTAAEFQRVRSKEILKEQARNLATANNVKDKLLSVISHDLINPMHHVMGFTELLRTRAKSYKKEKIIERVEIIDNSIKNIYFLLENLNDWSSIYREKINPHAEEFEFKLMLDIKLALFKFIIELKELNLNINIPADLKLYTDKHMFGSIIRNIISNAIKYTPKGGSITIQAKAHMNDIIVRIIDNGIGMTEEEIEHYMKLDNDKQDIEISKNKSAGLGLILSRNFVSRIKGTMQIYGDPGNGTTVEIIIPKN